MTISSTQLTTPSMRKFNYHAPNDRDTKRKMRSMYKPGIPYQEVRFSAKQEQPTAWLKNSTVKKYYELIPDEKKVTDLEKFNIPFQIKDAMNDGALPYMNQDWRRLKPDSLIMIEPTSVMPYVGTIFAAFIAGFFFEAYGADKDREESFLETDDDDMEEDACGRFYD
jgi:hypothetical protein